MSIIILIIGVICLAYGILYYHKATQRIFEVDNRKKTYEHKISELQNIIQELDEKKLTLIEEINIRQKQLLTEYTSQQEEINQQIEQYRKQSDYASEQYVTCLEQELIKAEKKYDTRLAELNQEYNDAKQTLEKLKNTLSAGMQAQLREQEKKDKVEFYKIQIPQRDIEDIERLKHLKLDFNQPTIISKLIWTNYCQKRVTEMCNRVLGKDIKCGIYKITNLQTEKCYIGQSVNVADRWKQHCKCGCDIDATATNRLYQDMINNGIWNFSFELIEECNRADLNAKEKLWINMYQSDLYGLNSTKGNK